MQRCCCFSTFCIILTYFCFFFFYRQRTGPEQRCVGALFGRHIAFGDCDASVLDGPPAAVAERGVQHGVETQGQHRTKLPFHAATRLFRETVAGRQDTAQAVGQLDNVQLRERSEP